LRAVALRLSQRRRGGQAAGARGAGRRDHGPGRADCAGGAARGVRVTLELQLFLLVWGTLVGLDLVSVPQMMIARPIVAGPVAAMAGDALRAAVVTAAGLALAHVVRLYFGGALPLRGVTLLGVAAVAGAIATATAGTLRVVGRGANLRWFAAGLAGGAVLVW